MGLEPSILFDREGSGSLGDICDIHESHLCVTLPNFNIAPEKLSSNRKVVFQPFFFRDYVKLREGTLRYKLGFFQIARSARVGFARVDSWMGFGLLKVGPTKTIVTINGC